MEAVGAEPENGRRSYGHPAQTIFCLRTGGTGGDGRRGPSVADVCDRRGGCDGNGTRWSAGGDCESNAETRFPAHQSAERANYFDGRRRARLDSVSGTTFTEGGASGDSARRRSKEERDGDRRGRGRSYLQERRRHG